MVSKDTSESTLSILFKKSPLDSPNEDKKPCVPYGTHPTTPNFLKHPTTEELRMCINKRSYMLHVLYSCLYIFSFFLSKHNDKKEYENTFSIYRYNLMWINSYKIFLSTTVFGEIWETFTEFKWTFSSPTSDFISAVQMVLNLPFLDLFYCKLFFCPSSLILMFVKQEYL